MGKSRTDRLWAYSTAGRPTHRQSLASTSSGSSSSLCSSASPGSTHQLRSNPWPPPGRIYSSDGIYSSTPLQPVASDRIHSSDGILLIESTHLIFPASSWPHREQLPFLSNLIGSGVIPLIFRHLCAVATSLPCPERLSFLFRLVESALSR